MSEHPTARFIKDANRESPFTFRFPRGTSGRLLAQKFFTLMRHFKIKNRSEVLRRCIEETYALYIKETESEPVPEV